MRIMTIQVQKLLYNLSAAQFKINFDFIDLQSLNYNILSKKSGLLVCLGNLAIIVVEKWIGFLLLEV